MDTEAANVLTHAEWRAEHAALQQRVAELEAQVQQAQASIGKQLRFTEALLAAIPTPVFFKDAQGRYLGCNDAFTEQMGVTAEEIHGKTVHELWPGEHAVVYHQKDLELLQHPQRQIYDFKVRDKNGQERDVLFAKNIFYDEAGQVAGLVGAYVDITERKQTEEALRASEERYRSLIEHSNDAIYLLYKDHFELINSRFAALFGVTPEEVCAPDFDFMSLVAPASRPLIEQRTRQLQAGQATPARYEFTALTRAGQEIEVEVSVSYIAYRDGLATQGILRDVSERKRAEREQQHLLERVQRQQKTVVALSLHPAFSAGDVTAAARFLTETVAKTLDVARASVWLLENEATELRCHDLYLYDEDAHQSGHILTATDFPAYFAALTQERTIDAHDARTDPRTNEFSATYLAPNGIASMLDATIRFSGAMVGVVCLEHIGAPRIWHADEITVAGAVADQMSQVLANAARKQAEEALVRSELMFRQSINMLPMGCVITDSQGNVNYINQMFTQMFGFTIQDIPHANDWFNRAYPDPTYRERVMEAWNTDLARLNDPEENLAPHIFAVTTKDGRTRTVEFRQSFIGSRLLILFNDITERQQTEQELAASQRMLNDVINTIPVRVFWKDLEGRFLGCNRLFAQDAGRPGPESLLGDNDFNMGWAEQAELYRADDRAVIEYDEPKINYEEPQTTPDGQQRWLRTSKIPLRDGEGHVYGILGVYEDITQRKALERQLRRHEQLAAIGQLAAGIAHDFRNLLTTIILYAQLGQRKPDLPSTVAQYLDTIVDEARKATDLVQQILDFSRRTAIDRRPLDLVALIGNVVAVLQRTLPENIHVAFDVGPGTCVIAGDAGRLQQALMNLALNARDAMPDGGTLRLGVTRIPVTAGAPPPLPEMMDALTPPAWICLSVADTGKGMTDEVCAHLFEPFFTTKPEGKGTGLGLAQVYGIIQLHDGYIDVENAIDKGVTVRIYLPAAADATEETAATAITHIPVGQGEKLLLVEDNAQLREAGQNLLTDLGYRVLTAANGQEALALYQKESNIALLITDLVMPEMGGKALVQALHNHNPNLKALVMTGYTAEEGEVASNLTDLRAAGFLEVIRKPLDAEIMAQAIRRALEAR